MKRHRHVIGAAIGLLCAGISGAEPPRLQVGEMFPDIAMPSVEDGTPLSIASFRGRKVILHVFASW